MTLSGYLEHTAENTGVDKDIPDPSLALGEPENMSWPTGHSCSSAPLGSLWTSEMTLSGYL